MLHKLSWAVLGSSIFCVLAHAMDEDYVAWWQRENCRAQACYYGTCAVATAVILLSHQPPLCLPGSASGTCTSLGALDVVCAGVVGWCVADCLCSKEPKLETRDSYRAACARVLCSTEPRPGVLDDAELQRRLAGLERARYFFRCAGCEGQDIHQRCEREQQRVRDELRNRAHAAHME